MRFDFTSHMDRRGKDALAVDAVLDAPAGTAGSPPPPRARALTSSPCGSPT